MITTEPSRVTSQYNVKYPKSIFVINQLPSLPDDKGNIVLLNSQGSIIDEMVYDEKWHFALITTREGIALERIDASLPAQNKNNWTSAASDAGYGTPTYQNSQYKSFQSLQGSIEVVPGIFSPDNDGRDDLCFVHYRLAMPNNVANITVFDINGHVIRILSQNATLSQTGFLQWDGLDDKGRTPPAGAYIILTELFDLQGNRKNFKNIVTIAHSF